MKYLISLFLILFFVSCDRKIDNPVANVENKLSVWCFFTPDSIFKVKVLAVDFANDGKEKTINDARVVIIENNNKTINLKYDSSQKLYIAYYYPKPGAVYQLKVKHKDYQEIEATDTVPSTKPQFRFSINKAVNVNSRVIVFSELFLDLYDNTQSKDFYKINLFKIDTLFIRDNEYYDEQPPDSVPYTIKIVKSEIELLSNDYIVEKNSYLNYYPYSVFFPDIDFKNSHHTFRLQFVDYATKPGYVNPYKLVISVKKISYNYFRFVQTAALQYYYTNRDELGIDDIAAVQLYGNIKNGIGIFAAYNSKNDTVELNIRYEIK